MVDDNGDGGGGGGGGGGDGDGDGLMMAPALAVNQRHAWLVHCTALLREAREMCAGGRSPSRNVLLRPLAPLSGPRPQTRNGSGTAICTVRWCLVTLDGATPSSSARRLNLVLSQPDIRRWSSLATGAGVCDKCAGTS